MQAARHDKYTRMSNNTPPQTYLCLSVFQAERCGPSLTRYPLPDQPTRHFSDSLFRHARPPSLFQTLPGCAWSVLSFLFALSAPPRFPSDCPSEQIACSRVECDDYYHVKSIMNVQHLPSRLLACASTHILPHLKRRNTCAIAIRYRS